MQHGASTLNLYRLAHPAYAFGHTCDEAVMQPDRILLLAPGTTLAAVEKRLSLQKPTYQPTLTFATMYQTKPASVTGRMSHHREPSTPAAQNRIKPVRIRIAPVRSEFGVSS